jgi:hypothetical protein
MSPAAWREYERNMPPAPPAPVTKLSAQAKKLPIASDQVPEMTMISVCFVKITG